ncbi:MULTISPECIES: phospholipase [unclassified Microbacterium]|uniref:aggregation-promoting factor C-terminal-like domain-containing protein n=1 Tax=unclassified Microbacterium TaxID=2609290 RepID=UPI003017EAE7
MLHKSRALRRASDAAAARSAVTARRPMAILGTGVAALVGITLSVGLASAPAAGAATLDANVAVARTMVGAEPLTRISEQTAATVSHAQTTVEVAQALTADVAASGLDVSAAPPVSTTALEKHVDALADSELMPALLVGILADKVEDERAAVVSDTARLQSAFSAAKEKKAAEDAARAAAEQAAAEAAAAQRAAEALAAANTVEGAKATAQQLMSSRYGWGGDQFSCLESLWTKESHWDYQAYNPSGATGIPQALPGKKMASAGADWQTSAATQIAWGLQYIADAYGTPCSAWAHSRATDWY